MHRPTRQLLARRPLRAAPVSKSLQCPLLSRPVSVERLEPKGKDEMQKNRNHAGAPFAVAVARRRVTTHGRARFPRRNAGPGASVRSGCRPEPLPFVRKNYISSSSSSSANSWSPPKRSAFRSLFTCMSGGTRGRQALAGLAAASRGSALHVHGARSAHATYG